jgi:DNA-3-methyladenine glycosylase II
MHYFKYSDEAIEHLRRCDDRMAGLIGRVGPMERELTPDLFEALASSIISQQISGKAAATVYSRFMELVGECTPESVCAADPAAMQRCGMSHRKVSYIRSSAEAVLDGRLPLDRIPSMNDEEVIRLLDALPGIGRWTAEMLLIFSLNRHNVLSYDDLGIRKGLMRIYGLESLPRNDFEHYRQKFTPSCSLASLYLWQAAEE